MPVSPATIYRGVILLAIIAHVMFMYGTARIMSESVGLQVIPTLIGLGFALAMVIPLFFAAGMPELPEALAHRRREKRWAAGRCPDCNYTISSRTSASRDAQRCPECGSVQADPGSYQFSWRTLRRFTAMLVLGWVLGCVACEGLLLHDEWRFRQEVKFRGVDSPWGRSRVWPFGSASLLHVPGETTRAVEST